MKNLVLICVSIFGLLASEVRGCSQGNLPSINWVNCRSAGFFGGLCDHCMSVNFRDGGSLDYICLNAATDNPSWCIYSGTLLNDINTPVALSGPSGCENNRNAKLELTMPTSRCKNVGSIFFVQNGVTQIIPGPFSNGNRDIVQQVPVVQNPRPVGGGNNNDDNCAFCNGNTDIAVPIPIQNQNPRPSRPRPFTRPFIRPARPRPQSNNNRPILFPQTNFFA